MSAASRFHDLVSGRRRGLWPSTARWLLHIAAVPYAAVVRWRNWRYDSGRVQTHSVGVPVISVGNLTLGGTGKTPMVAWLVQWLSERGVSAVVISRGYGAKAGSRNDEALELDQKLPGAPHLQNPNRVAAARKAIDELDCQAIVLDDGFQHRRIGRDLDIVLLDALAPFGHGHLFPRGTLREPVTGLSRADVVALSRADMLDSRDRDEIWRLTQHFAPRALWMEVAHARRGLISTTGRREAFETLRGKPVAAFCGLGNPAGFRHTLETCNFRVAAFREFPDHHRYRRADVKSLDRWVADLDVAAVLCTHKDLVKLAVEELGGRPLWALSIEIEILTGQDDFEARLRNLLPRI